MERPPEVQDWLNHLQFERRLAERTRDMYAHALGRLQDFSRQHQPPLSLAAVQSHHIRRWAAQLHAQGLAPRSIAIALAAWRGLYRWWGRQGRVAHNPVEGIRPPKAARPLPKALSVDQALALVTRSPEAALQRNRRKEAPALALRDQAISELLYSSGLRVGELTGLDLQAGDAAAGWVDLAEATAHVLGKGAKRRSVPIGRPAMEALRAWLAVRAELATHEEPALFVSRLGRRLTAQQLRLRLQAQAQDAGLPTHVHPHMLRHSFASHVLQSSGDLRAVQELLGHANISTTQVYTKLDFQHLAQVYDAAHPRAKASKKP